MNSITEIWEELADKYGSKAALKDETTGSVFSFIELYENINKIVLLLKHFNIEKNNNILLYLAPHPLWHAINQAIMKNNCVSVPCEPTSNFEEIVHILKETHSKSIFTDNIGFIEKIVTQEFVKHNFIIFYTGTKKINYDSNIKIYNLNKELEKINCCSHKINNIENQNNIAVILYSSGTTGDKPKGVMLTHKNVLLAVNDHNNIYGTVHNTQCINIQSCSHSASFVIELVLLLNGNTIIYTKNINLLKTVKKYKPKTLICVPKLIDKFVNEYNTELSKKNKLFKIIHSICFKISLTYIKKKKTNFFIKSLCMFNALFYKILYKNILNKFLNTETFFITFGSLLPLQDEYFFSIMKINIMVLYGLNEVLTYVTYRETMKENVNIVNPNFNMIICDITNDKKLKYNQTGIIKIKCEQTMKGYYKNEEKTKEVFDSNGYFITGDLGYLTKNNYLFFEGRQKNIIALNNGEKINPVKIEDICKQSPFVEQIIVVGQDKSYLTALIVLNNEFIKNYAMEKNIDISTNNGMEILKKEILIDINNLIGKNKFFKWIEQIKNISFINDEFTIENGFLTAKHTIIRSKIYEKYKTIIENMYK